MFGGCVAIGMFKLTVCFLLGFVGSQQFDSNLVIDGTADSPTLAYTWPVAWNQSRCSWNNNGWQCSNSFTCNTNWGNNNCGSPPSFMPEFSTELTSDPCEMFQNIDVTGFQPYIDLGTQTFRLVYSVSSFFMNCVVSTVDSSSYNYATLGYYTASSGLISTWASPSVIADLQSSCNGQGGPYYGFGCATGWITYQYDVVVPPYTAMIRLTFFASQGQNIYTVNTQVFTLFDTITFAAQAQAPGVVNCLWNPWNAWDPCNANCGGTQTRNRTSEPAQNGGLPCTGSDTSSQSCGPSCPIDCFWNAWKPWGSCNASCGGWQSSTRTYMPALYGGQPCTGPAVQTQMCSPPCYPINCTWNSWQPWEGCDVVCGGGIQLRYRTQNPALDGGQPCTGDYVDSQECGTAICPQNCIWTNWQEWSPCPEGCSGTQIRNRTMVPEQYGGLPCDGPTTESQFCTNSCPPPNLTPPQQSNSNPVPPNLTPNGYSTPPQQSNSNPVPPNLTPNGPTPPQQSNSNPVPPSEDNRKSGSGTRSHNVLLVGVVGFLIILIII